MIYYRQINKMIYKLKLILIFVFIAFSSQYAQQAIADSLETQLNYISGEKKVETLDRLADIYQNINTKKAIVFATKGAELAKEINYEKGLASCYGSIGYCYINLDNEKAWQYTQKALNIREKIGDKAGIATSLNVMGVINYYQNDYLISIENHLKAMKMREEVGDEIKIATSYNNISLVYIALEDYDTALKYLNKALSIRIKTNNKKGIAIVKANIGDVYGRMGKYDTAFVYLNESLSINKEIGNRISEAGTYLIIAKIYMQQNKNSGAENNYKMAFDLYYEMNEKNGIAQAENGLASIYEVEDKTDLAIKHGLAALSYAWAINSLDNVAKAANILQTEYSKLGNTKQAYYYLTVYIASSDSLKITDKIKKLAKTEFDYKIQEIKEQQNAEIAKQNIFIRWLTVSLVLGLIIVALIIFGYINNKKINRQLNELNEKLKELNATKDRFFSIIAHDLRGPFHSLLAFSDALSNDIENLSNDEIKDFNTNINNSLKKQFELLNNLLDWSRLQNENYNFAFENIQLYNELENTIETLSLAARQKEIDLINEVDKDTIVKADKNMLQLVLRNLISNSIKFSNKNGIIKVTSKQKEDHVEINVFDNGVGIAKDDLDKIFRIDVHYSTQGTAQEKGTGLGLILCKEIVEKHGGKISINSEPGRGTDVSFSLKTV